MPKRSSRRRSGHISLHRFVESNSKAFFHCEKFAIHEPKFRGWRMSALPPKADIRYRDRQCPLYPQKRTSGLSRGMSALCHKRTLPTSFDDLVGNSHHARWNGEAKRLGGLEINDQLELRRLQHGQVGGLLALENPASVDADLTVRIREAGSVAHQAAGLGVLAQLINRRNFVACSKSRQSIAGEKEMRTTSDDQCACSLPNSGRECRFEVPFTPNRRNPDRYPG